MSMLKGLQTMLCCKTRRLIKMTMVFDRYMLQRTMYTGEGNQERIAYTENRKNYTLTTLDYFIMNHGKNPTLKNAHRQEGLNLLQHTLCNIHARDKQSENNDYNKYLKTLPYSKVLTIVNSLILHYPFQFLKMPLYMHSIDVLAEAVKSKELNNQETVQLLYFAGMDKQCRASQVQLALKNITNFEELSTFEKCIIAETCFKCSIRMNNEQIVCLEKILEDDCEFLVQHPKWLVSICKALRLSGTSDKLNLSELSLQLIHNSEHLCMQAITHILQLYAELYVNDKQVLTHLAGSGIKGLSVFNRLDNRTKIDTRNGLTKAFHKPKCIDSFLWCLSRLRYKLTPAEYQEIIIYINVMFDTLITEPKRITNILLSLWMLGFKETAIIERCIRLNVFQKVISGETWKPRARLQLLMQCIELDNEHAQVEIPVTLKRIMVIGTEPSTTLKSLHKIIRSLASRLGLSHIRIDCPINALALYGISFKQSSVGKIHIDVLDSRTCFRDTFEPHGLFKLKLMLLEKLGYKSILINGNNVTDLVSTFVHVEDTICEMISKHE